MKTLKLPDGRNLAYETYGPTDGRPVVFLHGTGDSRLARHPNEELLKKLKVRLITFDRPGVGQSTRQPKRSLLSWVPDFVALVDYLQLSDFAVAAHSGGGPHALAVAHELGERVTKLSLASPLAPFDDPANQKLVKDHDLQLIFKLHHFKRLAETVGKLEAGHYAKHIQAFLDHCSKSYPADRVVFEDPELAPMFKAEFYEAFVQGGIGALDDMWAFLDWGFKLEDIAQSTTIFYGTADEILDSKMGAIIAKRLSNSKLLRWSGAGHYAVFSREHWKALLHSLV